MKEVLRKDRSLVGRVEPNSPLHSNSKADDKYKKSFSREIERQQKSLREERGQFCEKERGKKNTINDKRMKRCSKK